MGAGMETAFSVAIGPQTLKYAAAEFADPPGYPTRIIAARKRFENWLEDILAGNGIIEAAELARQIMILFDGAVAQILIHVNQAMRHWQAMPPPA